MAIPRLEIEEFLKMSSEHPVIDVRSPGEFNHAHIPSAYSLPLFSDEERKVVGTLYKQESREKAIKKGLEYFGVKMVSMVEEMEKLVQDGQNKTLLVHCWRGGMRSAAVAWLLDLYGFKIYTLIGGYKVFRQWVLAQFEKQYDFKIVGGYTGSGKTYLLKELKNKGQHVIDLEHLACHKGSAFGAINMPEQPKQEMFENKLAVELYKVQQNQRATADRDIWLEDESQRIGHLNIPNSLWNQMRRSFVFFVNIPFEERLKHIMKEYGAGEKEKLLDAIERIKKRLGGLETKMAINFLLEDNMKESFRVLLQYYDKQYLKGLQKRENREELLTIVSCDEVDMVANAEKILMTEKRTINA